MAVVEQTIKDGGGYHRIAEHETGVEANVP